MKTALKTFLLLVIIVVFVYTIVYLYRKSREKPVIYQSKSPYIGTIIKKTVATGTVKPRQEIDITPKVSGIISDIYVEPGQQVQKNDAIAKIQIIPDMLNLNNAESRLNKAKIHFQSMEKEYQRARQLYEKKILSESDFLNYEMNFKNAEEEMEYAQNNLQLIKEGITKKSGNTSNTIVRSTISGMILAVPVKVGNSVIESNNFNPGTTISTVANMNDMMFEGKVDESEVGKIHEGMKLILSIGAIEQEKFEAELEYISPKGIEENGAIQFEIRADVKLREKHFIRAGYSATADIVLDRRDSVMIIQESLLQFEKGKTFVEIQTSENQFEKKEILCGLSDGLQIEVISGLNMQDKIKVWNMAFSP
jgi:HlyD family secretion protein